MLPMALKVFESQILGTRPQTNGMVGRRPFVGERRGSHSFDILHSSATTAPFVTSGSIPPPYPKLFKFRFEAFVDSKDAV